MISKLSYKDEGSFVLQGVRKTLVNKLKFNRKEIPDELKPVASNSRLTALEYSSMDTQEPVAS